MDNVANNILTNEDRGWEYKQINVTRVPGYGFGIAVSGGRDNPHFASGDPSIAVSDVLASGPAEKLLQVNDRIISVNGISLQNVDYQTAVQVLRDSGDTVNLVVKRRVPQPINHNHHHHQHSLSALSASYGGPAFNSTANNSNNNIIINNNNNNNHHHHASPPTLPLKVTLTKNSKKEDFGIVLGCKLFIKEITSKARDQLINTNQMLNEGDFIVKLNNTNCNDVMSLKEAKKIIDSTKDKLHVTVAREFVQNFSGSHQTQSSISTTGAVNNFYKGDDFLTSTSQSYSNQNLYVQPPTRNTNLNNSIYDDKVDVNSGPNSLLDDKSNLVPRGGVVGSNGSRSRGPLLTEQNVENRSYGRSKVREDPPRPPPPRNDDYYSPRRPLYDSDPIIQKIKQPIPDARFITFHKEGSVGIRLTGGNAVGIFVTAVQPGSPASLQGLQPGDKILKVNDMDMTGVTREEAVLFLLGLQDRIELIVQFCKEEYDNIVASQRGDSFHIKTHYHYEDPVKGEMSFKSGDIFHVVDTLYNGVVGCWQVYKIGRNNQDVQKGIIPNKSRAEELATAQFNATKKEMSNNESRGSFFKRRRSSNRRSKSLGKEHWDDILFSDTVSKFPAYERVLLKHPGFTRPVIMFGPIADVARGKLLKDFPDKFISPQHDAAGLEDHKSQKNASNIIRLSAIREVISTGKHALLDVTPNAVERLNYAQMYPIVVFFKTETKLVVKQLRQGLPKSAHKSSKKLLEQCQKLDKVWSHVFSATIALNDNTDNWYRKVRDVIDKQQSGALWMSENKPEESLSDDFLFPMSSLRLSYASSPESDLEHSPGPPGAAPGTNSMVIPGRLTKASSDPSVVMADNSTVDILPPYQPSYDTRYGFNNDNSNLDVRNNSMSNRDIPSSLDQNAEYSGEYSKLQETVRDAFDENDKLVEFNRQQQRRQQQLSKDGVIDNSSRIPSKEALYGHMPELPPRVDRAAKPLGLPNSPTKVINGRSAHERLFGNKPHLMENSDVDNRPVGSLERSQNSKSDSMSSYDSFNKQQGRIGQNAHDDLKTTLSKIDRSSSGVTSNNSPTRYNPSTAVAQGQRWDQSSHRYGSKMDLKYGMSTANDQTLAPHAENHRSKENDKEVVRGNSMEKDSSRYSRCMVKQAMSPKSHVETRTDYGKYRSSHQDLSQSHLSLPSSPMKTPTPMNGFDHRQQQASLPPPSSVAYKPIPPPKPKNYKPPYSGNHASETMMLPQTPLNSANYQHGKSYSNPVERSGQSLVPGHNYYNNVNNSNLWQQNEQQSRFNSNNHNSHSNGNMVPSHGHYDMTPSAYDTRRHPGISYASRSEIQPISAMENVHHSYGSGEDGPANRPIVDLQGSREQRGSAFELYRKPVHHNLRGTENAALFGSQPNIAQKLTNSPKVTHKLTKTQSFKFASSKSEGFGPRILRKLSFKNRNKEVSNQPMLSRKSTDIGTSTSRENPPDFSRPSKRDVTSAIVDHKGGTLINEYWGVVLEVPEGAIPKGDEREIYFVVSDPRLCDNVPPLEFDNGESMLSPLVMCGPHGTEFLKPVILNIPHYANTLPSLGISLKATDSEQDVHTDWDNILLPSNHAANSVAVKVDHF